MKAALENWLLQVLRVPPEPSPPAGAPGSLRVFRAGRRYWSLRLFTWSTKQISAVIGILISVAFIQEVEWSQVAAAVRAEAIAAARAEAAAQAETRPPPEPTGESPAAAEAVPGDPAEDAVDTPAEEAPLTVNLPPRTGLNLWLHRVTPDLFIAAKIYGRIARQVPSPAIPWLKFAESLAIFGFLVQLPVTLLAARLDYTYRWYMVTDRSLRLRSGLFTVHETTMSFANLQQVEMRQGPLQRLLGLADLQVRSAGGGGGGESGSNKEGSEHAHGTLFEGVDNATEIRDLILARLQRFRAAGLGDPDDPEASSPTPTDGPARPSSTLEAARELAAAARDLRNAI